MKEQVQLELDDGPWPGDEYRSAWPVGGRIGGRVRVIASDVIKARGLRVELGWHTEGRGSIDMDTVAKQTLHEGNITIGLPNEWPFELAVPEDGPITYDGHYIRIRWEVKAIIDISLARDITDTRPISILPDYDRS